MQRGEYCPDGRKHAPSEACWSLLLSVCNPFEGRTISRNNMAALCHCSALSGVRDRFFSVGGRRVQTLPAKTNASWEAEATADGKASQSISRLTICFAPVRSEGPIKSESSKKKTQNEAKDGFSFNPSTERTSSVSTAPRRKCCEDMRKPTARQNAT